MCGGRLSSSLFPPPPAVNLDCPFLSVGSPPFPPPAGSKDPILPDLCFRLSQNYSARPRLMLRPSFPRELKPSVQKRVNSPLAAGRAPPFNPPLSTVSIFSKGPSCNSRSSSPYGSRPFPSHPDFNGSPVFLPFVLSCSSTDPFIPSGSEVLLPFPSAGQKVTDFVTLFVPVKWVFHLTR